MLEGQANFTYHKIAGRVDSSILKERKKKTKNEYIILNSSGCIICLKSIKKNKK